jgi:hypothetical protein
MQRIIMETPHHEKGKRLCIIGITERIKLCTLNVGSPKRSWCSTLTPWQPALAHLHSYRHPWEQTIGGKCGGNECLDFFPRTWQVASNFIPKQSNVPPLACNDPWAWTFLLSQVFNSANCPFSICPSRPGMDCLAFANICRNRGNVFLVRKLSKQTKSNSISQTGHSPDKQTSHPGCGDQRKGLVLVAIGICV